MFIQTEDTPNPETLKFIPGENVLNKGTVDFSNKEESILSPLASRLFEIDGVSEELAREAFKLASAKLPFKVKFIAKKEAEVDHE